MLLYEGEDKMSRLIYQRQSKRREELIKKLFLVISKKKTIKEELNDIKQYPTMTIISETSCGSSFNYDTLHIKININAIVRITKDGYKDDYYMGRKTLINKYTLHNRHNETRFVICHELKHFCDRIKYGKDPYLTFGEEEAERRADSFALSKLNPSRI